MISIVTAMISKRQEAVVIMLEDCNCIEFHGIVLHTDKKEAFLDGRLLPLTRMQFSLLHFLISHAGETYTRQQIIVGAHGADYPATDRSVDGQIMELRRKLGDRDRIIECVRGVGYRVRG